MSKLPPVPVTLNVEWKREQESKGSLIHITAQAIISLDTLARTIN